MQINHFCIPPISEGENSIFLVCKLNTRQNMSCFFFSEKIFNFYLSQIEPHAWNRLYLALNQTRTRVGIPACHSFRKTCFSQVAEFWEELLGAHLRHFPGNRFSKRKGRIGGMSIILTWGAYCSSLVLFLPPKECRCLDCWCYLASQKFTLKRFEYSLTDQIKRLEEDSRLKLFPTS